MSDFTKIVERSKRVLGSVCWHCHQRGMHLKQCDFVDEDLDFARAVVKMSEELAEARRLIRELLTANPMTREGRDRFDMAIAQSNNFLGETKREREGKNG